MLFQFWVPLLVTVVGTHCVCVFARFGCVGHVAAQSSTPPTRAAMTNKRPTHRGVPNRTKQRASDGLARGFGRCSIWRAAMHWFSASSLHFKFAATETRSKNWHHYLRIKTSLGRAPNAKISVAIRETARQRLTLERTRPRRIAA